MKTEKCKCSALCLENPDIGSTVKIRLMCLELAMRKPSTNVLGSRSVLELANTYYDWVLKDRTVQK